MINLEKAILATGDHIWSSEKETGSLLAALINLCKFKHVAETGVFKGRTSCYMINALPPSGKYVGIDIEDHRPEAVKEFMKDHQFILGDSREKLKDLPDRYFDLIFMDSAHELDFLREEFKTCEKKIRKDGIIALHDAYLPEEKAWIDYIKLFKWFEIINLDTRDDRGYNRGLALVKCLYG